MQIYIEHDSATIEHLTGRPRPGCDGVIMRLGDPADVLACTVRANPLGETWLLDAEAPGRHVVTWSGSMADSLFDSHPMTWFRPGHEALARFCDDTNDSLREHDRRLVFQPHARHVLSDPQSCLNFLRERECQPFDIALAPASFLEVSMLDAMEDHLTRAFAALGSVAAMVMLHDVERPSPNGGSDAAAPMEPAPLGRGVLPAELVRELIRQHVPQQTPIVLRPQDIDAQMRWLGLR